MSARRQASTTSLSQFAHTASEDFTDRSLDFCNAFWGLGDGGVDVLFARMRGATRTMEELRNFWKERASIEEQYAKRLVSLAKTPLGRDEIGELRASLDVLRQETEKQAGYHLLVAQQIRTDLEGQTAVFINKQQHHKKTYQAAIEKELKTKQTQESYVNKAREKYEADCVRINSYTAQSTLMQGKDLDKIQTKLERAQQTVQANERDFANFARALQETVQKWEQDWKSFCDSCQDLEEERLEFMKDNMWAYANAVSTVCVADDESCEKLRLALEMLEPERDMENFVRDYGTGSAIPDPPAFVNYANPDAVPPSSQRPSTRPADFARTSQRARQAPQSPLPQDEEEPPENMTGVGRGGGRPAEPAPEAQVARNRSRSHSRAQPPAEPPLVNPFPAPAQTQTQPSRPQTQAPPAGGMRQPDPQADPIDPTATTMIKIGDNAYKVDLANDPQARTGQAHPAGAVKVGQEDDPLARQMAELQKAAPVRGASVRKSWQAPPAQGAAQSPVSGASGSPTKGSAKLSPPPGGSGSGRSSSRDYRRSAEIVVGLPPVASSRPASPNPPYPNATLTAARAEHGGPQLEHPRAGHPRGLPAVVPGRAQVAQQADEPRGQHHGRPRPAPEPAAARPPAEHRRPGGDRRAGAEHEPAAVHAALAQRQPRAVGRARAGGGRAPEQLQQGAAAVRERGRAGPRARALAGVAAPEPELDLRPAARGAPPAPDEPEQRRDRARPQRARRRGRDGGDVPAPAAAAVRAAPAAEPAPAATAAAADAPAADGRPPPDVHERVPPAGHAAAAAGRPAVRPPAARARLRAAVRPAAGAAARAPAADVHARALAVPGAPAPAGAAGVRARAAARLLAPGDRRVARPVDERVGEWVLWGRLYDAAPAAAAAAAAVPRAEPCASAVAAAADWPAAAAAATADWRVHGGRPWYPVLCQGAVRLSGYDRRGIRLPVWGHYCGDCDSRRWMVVWRALGRSAQAARPPRLPKQLRLPLLSSHSSFPLGLFCSSCPAS
ncbi:hypothetical protein WOLCODRAFT_140515 [Wolfiporia cocos MD-104 SS10]|uniref:F-BAR domain-containing protein n=1 Tax=Wolfiporia cocos (strain MD-104) TaxID=742152 RepID=A0A2H3J9W1_WOLCO|nr:hypothetical protein WOLCODRAFT_140515 [Wolfiporia cocos MD-104 SS10]